MWQFHGGDADAPPAPDTGPPTVDTGYTPDTPPVPPVRDTYTSDTGFPPPPEDTRDRRDTDLPADVCLLTHPYTGHEPVLRAEWTADDEFQAWLDGKPVDTSSDWKTVTSMTERLTPGRHVVSVRAEDLNDVVTGFIGKLGTRETVPQCMTTGGRLSGWRVTATQPTGAWKSPGYDDSDWTEPTPADSNCRRSWGMAVDIRGADWVWHEDCEVGTEGWNEKNWYRLEFEFRLQ